MGLGVNYSFPEWTWVILISIRIVAILGLFLAIERSWKRRGRHAAVGLIFFTLGYIIATVDGINHAFPYERLRLSTLLLNVGVCYLSYYMSIVKGHEHRTTPTRSRSQILR